MKIEFEAHQCPHSSLRFVPIFEVRGKRMHDEARTIDYFLREEDADNCADSYRKMRDDENLHTIYDLIWVVETILWV